MKTCIVNLLYLVFAIAVLILLSLLAMAVGNHFGVIL